MNGNANNTQLVSFSELAEQAGVGVTTIYKCLNNRPAFEKFKDKIVLLRSGKNNKHKRFLHAADAEEFLAIYRQVPSAATTATVGHGSSKRPAARQGRVPPSQETNSTSGNSDGFLYIIQLAPHKCPQCCNELKIGWSNDMKRRLGELACGAPHAKVLKTWSCEKSLEHVVASIIAKKLRHVKNEVWEGDANTAIEIGNTFFDMLHAD